MKNLVPLLALLVVPGRALADPVCHKLTFDAPVGLADDIAGSAVRKTWTVDATFDPASPYECRCCEYFQEVKGSFTVDGNAVRIQLVEDDPANPGSTRLVDMETGTYHEDSRDYGSGRGRYGHRGEAQTWTESYTTGGTGPDASTPNRATGCTYHGSDAPGWGSGSAGHTYVIDLKFRGSIRSGPGCVECNGCESKEWDADLTRTFPAPPPPPGTPIATPPWLLTTLLAVLALFGASILAERRGYGRTR